MFSLMTQATMALCLLGAGSRATGRLAREGRWAADIEELSVSHGLPLFRAPGAIHGLLAAAAFGNDVVIVRQPMLIAAVPPGTAGGFSVGRSSPLLGRGCASGRQSSCQ